jgi:hypothetical protein
MDLNGSNKRREIRHNAQDAQMLGVWLTGHPGHCVELRGDEYNYMHEYSHEDVAKYFREFVDVTDSCLADAMVETVGRVFGTAKEAGQ